MRKTMLTDGLSIIGMGQNLGVQKLPTRWWFQCFFLNIFTRNIWGRCIQFDDHIFQMGGSTTN